MAAVSNDRNFQKSVTSTYKRGQVGTAAAKIQEVADRPTLPASSYRGCNTFLTDSEKTSGLSFFLFLP